MSEKLDENQKKNDLNEEIAEGVQNHSEKADYGFKIRERIKDIIEKGLPESAEIGCNSNGDPFYFDDSFKKTEEEVRKEHPGSSDFTVRNFLEAANQPHFLNTNELEALIEAGAKDSRLKYKNIYKNAI